MAHFTCNILYYTGPMKNLAMFYWSRYAESKTYVYFSAVEDGISYNSEYCECYIASLDGILMFGVLTLCWKIACVPVFKGVVWFNKNYIHI